MKPNYERLENLIIALDGAEHFDMCRFGHDCDTPACVLGHYAHRTDLQSEFVLKTNMCYGRTSVVLVSNQDQVCWSDEIEVQEHFGIDQNRAAMLFNEDGCGDAGNNVTQARRYLREFIDDLKEQEAAGEFREEQYPVDDEEDL